MASINFRTRGKNIPNASIYITFRNGRNCILEINSGITVPNSDWIAKGNTRNIAAFGNKLEVQQKLNDLRAKVTTELNRTSNYTKGWLQGIVNAFHGIAEVNGETQAEPTFAEMIESYIDHILNVEQDPCTPNTAKSYRATKARIEKFDAYKGHVHKVNEIGATYRGEFIHWARTVEKYAPATYQKSVKQIKTTVTHCQEMGMEIDESLLKKITRRKGGVKRIDARRKPLHINLEEIDCLMDYKGPEYLENARDWLVVSCWTGCRVSDLLHLTEENIEITITGDKAIRYKQSKTQKEVTTPFHPHLERITARHGGSFPRKISDQKYNKYIKQLCEQVGMNELIEGEKKMMVMVNGEIVKRTVKGIFPKHELIVSHIGRRSFATNHYGKMPSEMIMMVTGHSTINQFLEYVGEHSQDHVTRFNHLYRDIGWKVAAAN